MADAFSVLLSRLAEQHKRDVTEATLPGSLAVRNLVEENRKLRRELEELRLRSELEEYRLPKKANWELSCQTTLPDEAADMARTLPGVPTEQATEDVASSGPLLSFRPAMMRLAADVEVTSSPTARTSRRDTMAALPSPANARGEANPPGSVPGRTSPTVVDPLSLRPKPLPTWCSEGSQRLSFDKTTSNCAHINKAVSALDHTHRNKQERRFQYILQLRPKFGKNLTVTVDDLHTALDKRRGERYSATDVAAIFSQLWVVARNIGPKGESKEAECSQGMPFNMFVELMLMADLPSHVGREMAEDIADIQDVFLSDDIEDVIWRVSHRQAVFQMPYDQGEEASTTKWMSMLNTLAGATVVVSLVFLSLSLDFSPNWPGWIAFEAIFLCVFVLEIVVKMWLLGWTKFCCGPECHVNWLDTFITMTALFDLLTSIATFNSTQSAARITMVLRVLRLSRVVRLLKLLQTPLLHSLANLLSGFVIGVPWLLWVLVLLISVLFIMGIIFRYMLGPVTGEGMLSTCGYGDDADVTNPECKVHYLYGEEFFGSVHKSMFTVFRCMIGDCTTKGGQALTVHFSQGFGLRFDTVYFIGMVIVIFGLFNIITSIFVEATLSGLKHNDVQRKYHKLYEARYVEGKLKALVRRINEILAFRESNRDGRTFSLNSIFWGEDRSRPLGDGGNFTLSEAQFVTVMQDSVVNVIFDDLDVVQFNRTGLFEMFDTNGSGSISVVELVETLVKLRGDPQKSDMVAAWVGLRALHEKFECFQMLLLENQKMMLNNQERLRTAVGSKIQSPEDQ